MPEAQLGFLNDQQSGLDPLGGASPVAMNVMMAGKVIRRRPGLRAYSGAPAESINADGVSGLHIVKNGRLFAVGGETPNRRIYLVSPGGAVSLSGASSGDLPGTGRPVFAETQALLAIAGGLRVQKVLMPGVPGATPLANAPENTHIVANAQRLIAIDPSIGDTWVAYSGVQSAGDGTAYAAYEEWGEGIGTAGVFPASAAPDPVIAIAENSNEVFVWGTTSLQVFTQDPTDDFAPVTSRQVGLAAAYSVVRSDQQFAWLDHLRRFVISDGRDVIPVSTGIQTTLDELVRVDDCWGFRFQEGPIDAFVWVFPSDGRTFAFQKGSGWSEWMGWNSVGLRPAPMALHAHHLKTGTSTNIVGTTAGVIAQLTTLSSTDFDDPIHAYVTTGFQNHGTDARKHTTAVRLTLRRGETADDGEPRGLLSYRNDLGPWSPPISVSLGRRGTWETVVQLRSVGGAYRRRQWRFEFAGVEDLVLAEAAEEFEVLG